MEVDILVIEEIVLKRFFIWSFIFCLLRPIQVDDDDGCQYRCPCVIRTGTIWGRYIWHGMHYICFEILSFWFVSKYIFLCNLEHKYQCRCKSKTTIRITLLIGERENRRFLCYETCWFPPLKLPLLVSEYPSDTPLKQQHDTVLHAKSWPCVARSKLGRNLSSSVAVSPELTSSSELCVRSNTIVSSHNPVHVHSFWWAHGSNYFSCWSQELFNREVWFIFFLKDKIDNQRGGREWEPINIFPTKKPLSSKITTKDSHTNLLWSRSHNGPTNPRNKSLDAKRKHNLRSKALSQICLSRTDRPWGWFEPSMLYSGPSVGQRRTVRIKHTEPLVAFWSIRTVSLGSTDCPTLGHGVSVKLPELKSTTPTDQTTWPKNSRRTREEP
jgi:hypothetical protein